MPRPSACGPGGRTPACPPTLLGLLLPTANPKGCSFMYLAHEEPRRRGGRCSDPDRPPRAPRLVDRFEDLHGVPRAGGRVLRLSVFSDGADHVLELHQVTAGGEGERIG